MKSILRPVLASLALAALLAVSAAPAHASSATLRRGLSNLIFAPVDFALSPVVAVQIIRRNLRDTQDPLASRILYPVPGFMWDTWIEAGASVIRGVTGLLEVPPGLVLVFFENDIDPMFDPVETSSAIVDRGGDVFAVKFGIDYMTTPLY